MRLLDPHTRTVHRHGVSIRVEDDPILAGQASRHAPEYRFRCCGSTTTPAAAHLVDAVQGLAALLLRQRIQGDAR